MPLPPAPKLEWPAVACLSPLCWWLSRTWSGAGCRPLWSHDTSDSPCLCQCARYTPAVLTAAEVIRWRVSRALISCPLFLLSHQTFLVVWHTWLGKLSSECLCEKGGIKTSGQTIMFYCFSRYCWPHASTTNVFFLRVLLCHTETVCDHHLQ